MAAAQATVRGPALAVLSSDGELERSTAEFDSRGEARALLEERPPELEEVLRGERRSAVLSVDGVTAAAELVVDATGRHHTLLRLAETETASAPTRVDNPLLSADLDGSPAVIFLKDLDGRYLRVNAAHGKLIGGGEAQLLGHTDADLDARLTVDGPRLAERDPSVTEPQQLEYLVPAHEKRPALSALRFVVHDGEGNPVALCGVASPLHEGEVARSEAERLMDLERLAYADPETVRGELLDRWGLRAGEPVAAGARATEQGPSAPASPRGTTPAAPAEPVAAPAGVSSEELENAQLRAEQARVAAEQARAEANHLRSELELAQAEIEQARTVARREHEDAEGARAASQGARAEAAQALVKIEQLEASAASLSSRFEQAEAEARESARRAEAAEAQSAQVQARAEAADAAAREALARAEEAEARVKRAETRAEEAEGRVKRAETRAEEAEAALHQARERLAELERARRQADTRIEELQVSERQARLEVEQLEGAARQARVQLDELEAAAARARGSAEEAEAAVRQWRARAEAAEAELETARKRPAQVAKEGDSAATAAAVELRQRLAALESERDASTDQAQEARETLAAERARTDELRRALSDAQERLSGLSGELEAARARQAASGGEVEALTAARRDVASAEAARRDAELAAERARLEAAAELEAARRETAVKLEAAQRAATVELEATRREAKVEIDAARREATLEADAARREAKIEVEAARREVESVRHELEAAQQRAEEASREAQLRTEEAQQRAEEEAQQRAEEEAQAALESARRQTEQPAAANKWSATARSAPNRASGDDGEGLRWTPIAQRELAQALGDVDELRTGFMRAASVLGIRGGWDLVAAWVPDTRGVLRCSASWSRDPLRSLERLTQRSAQPVSGSALGAALYAREPAWLSPRGREVPADDRLAQAAEAGVHTALLLPIRDGVARIGLLELLAEQERAPESELVSALEAVGLQLGQFAALMRARRAGGRDAVPR